MSLCMYGIRDNCFSTPKLGVVLGNRKKTERKEKSGTKILVNMFRVLSALSAKFVRSMLEIIGRLCSVIGHLMVFFFPLLLLPSNRFSFS